MPGLSSSTLNLKFMQRGAARATPSAPSTPASKPATGNSTPQAESSTSIPLPETPTVETPQLIASEEPYRWSLARTSKPTPSAPSGVKFETSYLPFIDQTHRDDSPEAGPSRGGGGRMVFGYKEPEQEDLKDEEDEEEVDEEGDVIINVKKEKGQEKEREKGKREYKKPRPMMNEKGFMRPRSRSPEQRDTRGGAGKGSLLPSTSRQDSRSSEKKDKDSRSTHSNSHKSDHSKPRTADTSTRVKVERSSPAVSATPKSNGDSKNKKRKPSQSTPSTSTKFNINTTGRGAEGKKARLSSPTMLNEYPTQLSQSSNTQATTTTTTIDDREAALKAQRKKEKNAKKKARKSAE